MALCCVKGSGGNSGGDLRERGKLFGVFNTFSTIHWL